MSKKRIYRDDRRRREFPEEVERFVEYDYNKFKKENKGFFRKKEMRDEYHSQMTQSLEVVIDWLLRNGHIQDQEIQDMRNKCLAQLTGNQREGIEYIEYLTKRIKDEGRESIENIMFFPIIIHQIIEDIIRYNETEEDESKRFNSPDDLFNLYGEILKKRMKKARKRGIDNEDLVFDLLGVMPVPEAIKYSRFFRIRGVFDIIYRYAEKDPLINVRKILTFLFYEEDMPDVIEYALLEKKSKLKAFNENQKKIFTDITNVVFTELEDMRKDEIRDILRNYVKMRKKDAAANKDENRRFYIASLPETKYPHIVKVVNGLIYDDEDIKRYL